MASQKKIAVIGAGPSGLAAIKSCLEEEFVPVCYERNSDPGGLWRYHDEDIEGVASVMRTTIMNTGKEMSAFSDFPPPKEFPNFMHNSKMFEYFMRYAEHFHLLKYIKYNFEVMKIKPTEDFDQTGRWIVSVKNAQTNAVTKDIFDAVMVCIGIHVFPKMPNFQGQSLFKGTIVHTHSLKSCDQFVGKNVAVVGIGNSGVDAAIDSTNVAKQVYLSTRRGSWILSRIGINGRPYDMDFNSRLRHFQNYFRSYDAICSELEEQCNSKFDHAAYKLKPKHRILGAHPTLNDSLPNTILSGRVLVKGDIERFEESGVVFVGENTVTQIDAVIFATGYHLKFPFLDKNILPINNNVVHLYKYSIPPHLNQNTLALIGLVQPLGPIFPVSEMQARWFIQIQAGKLKLPNKQEMEKDIQRKKEANSRRYVDSTRHTVQENFMLFMDELAEMIGVKPNFLKMSITDPKLFWACINGPTLPYQYRLVRPHSWPGAREAILNLEERIYTPLNAYTKKIPIKGYNKKGSFLRNKNVLFIVALGVAGLAISKKYDDVVPLRKYLKL